MLAAAPLFLLYGLAAGFIGPGVQSLVLGLPALAAFISILVAGLRVALEPGSQPA